MRADAQTGSGAARSLESSLTHRKTTMKTDKQLQTDVIAELSWEPSVHAAEIGVTQEFHLSSNTARVRNPRSIRQLVAASNTLVRSARRHVEAQRQASQRRESPHFTVAALQDLRVVGGSQSVREN